MVKGAGSEKLRNKKGETEQDGQSDLQTELNKAKRKNNNSWDSQSDLKSVQLSE